MELILLTQDLTITMKGTSYEYHDILLIAGSFLKLPPSLLTLRTHVTTQLYSNIFGTLSTPVYFIILSILFASFFLCFWPVIRPTNQRL